MLYSDTITFLESYNKKGALAAACCIWPTFHLCTDSKRRVTHLEVQRTVLIQVVFDERLFFLSLKVDNSWFLQVHDLEKCCQVQKSIWPNNSQNWS